jgi:hypothetical protein
LVYHLQKVSRIKPMAKEEQDFRIVGKKSSSKLKGEPGFPEVPAGGTKELQRRSSPLLRWQIFGEKEKTPKR